MNNWCVGCWSLGDFWDDFCIELPDLFIDNALIWETEIKDAYEAYLVIDHNYTFQNAIEFMLDFSNLAMDLWGTGDATNFTQITYPGHNLDWGLQVQFFYGPLAYGNNLFFPYYYPWDVTNASLATKFLDMSVVPAGLEVTVDMNQNVYNGYGGTAQIKATSYAGATESGSIILRTFGAANVKDETYTFDPADLPNPEKVTIEAYADWNYSAADLWQYYGCDITSATETAMGFLEISIDGGDTWQILDTFTGTSNGDVTDTYDITPWAGNDILIRFRVEGNDDSTDDRWWCINDAFIAGKTDESAPVSSATMSGTMKESGWYTTGVKVTITATDVGVGMGEIHYILDGSETVVSGDTAEFTVSGNGEHNIEFWAVDAMGNEETPHNTIPTFRIDMGSAPSVQITAPEPGLYLFGNKLLSASKVIIIGAFTVEATASDAESGIYRVQFFLDGDLISEDTEIPFSAYVAEKHMGAGTIKVVAEDFAQNTAEDTLDITYYKFL
jgi:plastocyanin